MVTVTVVSSTCTLIESSESHRGPSKVHCYKMCNTFSITETLTRNTVKGVLEEKRVPQVGKSIYPYFLPWK